MSRRHKIEEKEEKLFYCKEASDKISIETKSENNNSARYNINLNHFLVIKESDVTIHISLEKVINSILKKLKVVEHDLTDQIRLAVIEAINDQEGFDESDYVKKRGRRKIHQLLGRYKNNEVISWFDKIRKRFKAIIASIKELMVCFFCALFDIIPSESRHGKATSFFEIIKKHLKEEVPSKSMFQKALKWFKGWRKEVTPWKNKNAEEEEHSIWDRLYQLIKKELPKIEPQLVTF